MRDDTQGLAPEAQDGFAYELSKRAVDIVGGLVGLALLAPLLLVIGIAVKTSSPGPVFYRGERTGRYGKPFRIFKFRSMIVGADRGAGTTSRSDTRVTSVGRFLRRHKLDELPQLLNVLRGDMSFVGPRPELPRYTEQYTGEQLIVLAVKPGITDYASLEFANLHELIDDDNPDRSFEERVLNEKNRLRVQYVRDRGFWLDIRLIILTIAHVLRVK